MGIRAFPAGGDREDTPVNGNPTSTLPPPTPAGARVDLPHTSCEALADLPEAAVLFAAGLTDAARACLEQSIARMPSEPRAWTMLFELHQALDDRAAFDSLAERYARARPGAPVPPWVQAPCHAHAEMIRMSGVLADEAVVMELLAQGRRRRVVALDVADVTRIDYGLAPKFCGALRLLSLQSKRVILANVGELHHQLLALMGLPSSIALISRRASANGDRPGTEEVASLQAA